MSKYNLTELLSEVQGGRIGTLNITAMDLERKMEELEGEGIKVSTFDGDNFGKTYIEYHVHPENKYDPDESFSIYDYKFGEDPTDLENEDVEYPFSIGGRGAAISSAKALLGSGEVSYRIDEAKPGYNEDGTTKSNDEMGDDEREDFYNDLDSVEESFDSLAKKLDKQKGIDKDEAAKIAGSIAAKKAAGAGKGPTAKQKKRMKEASDTFNIDKVASPDAKAHDYGDEIKGISDEDDTEEKYAHQTVTPLEEDDYTDRKGKALYPILKAKANATGDEVELYVQSLAKDIELNGKEQYREFTSDDFVEDFKEFIGNKSLKEHFNRFK